MEEIIKQFVIGGVFVSGISYVGNFVNPVLAGLLAGLPIGLPSTYFILTSSKAKDYVSSLALTTILLTIVTCLFYYLFVHTGYLTKNIGIVVSMTIWLTGVILIWQYKTHMK
jgi:hypothetical protein